jgi:hypothetical protein
LIEFPSNISNEHSEEFFSFCDRFFSNLSSNTEFLFESSEIDFVKSILKGFGSISLIENIDFEKSKILLHPNSLFDNSDRFIFSVCGKEFECCCFGASLLSFAASKHIFIENEFSLEIECPSNFEHSKFISTFCTIFESLNGFPFQISNFN